MITQEQQQFPQINHQGSICVVFDGEHPDFHSDAIQTLDTFSQFSVMRAGTVLQSEDANLSTFRGQLTIQATSGPAIEVPTDTVKLITDAQGERIYER